jgi:hypothetical protein
MSIDKRKMGKKETVKKKGKVRVEVETETEKRETRISAAGNLFFVSSRRCFLYFLVFSCRSAKAPRLWFRFWFWLSGLGKQGLTARKGSEQETEEAKKKKDSNRS